MYNVHTCIHTVRMYVHTYVGACIHLYIRTVCTYSPGAGSAGAVNGKYKVYYCLADRVVGSYSGD